MNSIEVNTLRTKYYIHFVNHIDDLSKFKNQFAVYDKILIITDDNVEKKYLSIVADALSAFGPKIFSFVIKNGEPSKNIDNAMKIIDYMATVGFHRKDTIVALGGGVVGDLAGFVASIFMRGIDFIQIPTTLLSAVDASIGGKTAVDIQCGKNLVGTFHQPKLIIDIVAILNQNPDELLTEGAGEIIKYGIIYDKTILTLMNDGLKKNIVEILLKCAKAKADIVSKDEYENGLRKTLNFGHTLAHSIEKCSGYQITHGVAVAYGMLFALFVAKEIGYCKTNFYVETTSLINKYFSLSKLDFPADDLVFYMKKDKKNEKNEIVLVLANDIDVMVKEFQEEAIKAFLNRYLDEGKRAL